MTAIYKNIRVVGFVRCNKGRRGGGTGREDQRQIGQEMEDIDDTGGKPCFMPNSPSFDLYLCRKDQVRTPIPPLTMNFENLQQMGTLRPSFHMQHTRIGTSNFAASYLLKRDPVERIPIGKQGISSVSGQGRNWQIL